VGAKSYSVTVQGRATGAYVSLGELNASNDDDAKTAAINLVKTKIDDVDLDDWVLVLKDGEEIEPRSTVAQFVRNS
jgi:hypothetical protein